MRIADLKIAVAALALSVPLAARPLELRLLDGIKSYGGSAQTTFRAVVTVPYEKDGKVWLPAGSVVSGSVAEAKSVGIGFARERARIRLEFTEYELPDGRRFPLVARVRRVDNAREDVDADGCIKGILAANNFQSFLGGVWMKPDSIVFPRVLMGLTGLTGRIWSQFSMGPIGAGALIATRFALVRMPEPEIQLPRGTELIVTVEHLPADAPSFDLQALSVVERDVSEWLTDQPFTITKPGNRPSKDIINVAFYGTRADLIAAFEASGWREAEPRTPGSLSRSYAAYSRQAGYATAPASKLLYRDEEPDFVFQKTFNTMAKRHHVRLWRAEQNGREVWLGGATHDIGVVFHAADMSFSHRIHPRIDYERGKIVNDLAFAGCIEPVGYVDRPAAVRDGGEQSVVTDGRMAVLKLRQCSGVSSQDGAVDSKPLRSHAARMLRRVLLETRNYGLRGNPYYWAYRAVRWRPRAQEAKLTGVEE